MFYFKARHRSGDRDSVINHGKVAAKLPYGNQDLHSAQKGSWKAGFPGGRGGLEAILKTSPAPARLTLQGSGIG